MSRFHRFVPLACSIAVCAGAQTTSTPTAAPPEVVSLQNFVVTASPLQREQADLAQSTTVLAGAELDLRQQPTLGETLAGQPGVSSTWFGPGASRPVIRGLGGDRIRILENSVGTIDASVASPDHAVSVEPFLVEKIEVVRGPASLLYGSSAVGGVVNVVTHRIEHALPEQPVSGLFDFRYGGNSDEKAGGGTLDLAKKTGADRALVLHLDGFKRETGDTRIPGFARSAALRADDTAAARAAGEPAPEFAEGFIPNTAIDSRSGAVGLSFVTDKTHAGLDWSGFDTFYGVPNEEDVKIDLRQRRVDFQAETTESFGPFSGARLKAGSADYRHAEIEDGQTGTVFTNRGHDARVELLHDNLGGWAGVWGAQASRSDFAALGDEAFLPPSLTRNHAVFAFEETKLGAFTPQAGVRYERQTIDVDDGSGRARDDNLLSWSAGSLWNPAPGWVAALSVVHTLRAPNAQELLADGPHIGTNAFEVGDATLGRERSTGVELVLRKPAGRVTGELSVYENRFRGYIAEQPTGQVAVERDGEFVLIDPAQAAAGEEPLTEYRFTQGGAKFRGAEAEIVFHLHETSARQLHLRLSGDLVRAEDDNGVPLPRIPPARLGAGLSWTNGGWSLGADCQRTFAQRRVAANETASDGYTFVSAHVAYTWQAGRTAWNVFVRGSNLTDEEARPHTSFLKELAPLPGRDVSAGVRWIF